jgi:hypothetical protein
VQKERSGLGELIVNAPHWRPCYRGFIDAKVIRKFADVPDDLSAL